jgi:hypothetical protein
MAGVGHQHQFPHPEPSARYGFGQGTFAGTRGNERDAPFPDLPPSPRNGGGSTESRFPRRETLDRLATDLCLGLADGQFQSKFSLRPDRLG